MSTRGTWRPPSLTSSHGISLPTVPRLRFRQVKAALICYDFWSALPFAPPRHPSSTVPHFGDTLFPLTHSRHTPQAAASQAFRPHCPIPTSSVFRASVKMPPRDSCLQVEKALAMLAPSRVFKPPRHISRPCRLHATFYPAASPPNVTLPRSQMPPSSRIFQR